MQWSQRIAERDASGRRRPGASPAAEEAAESARVLVRVLAERSADLGTHHVDVADLCEIVCGRLGLAEDDIEAIVEAAALHDIGKAALPDAILDKPGPLSEDEWEIMRDHTVIGERILAAAPSLERASVIVRASHERWDGTGYPDGLVGEEIPFASRIIAVCDAYDAMSARRAYRPPFAPRRALAELTACSGTQFDPLVVDAFCAVLAERLAARAGEPVISRR